LHYFEIIFDAMILTSLCWCGIIVEMSNHKLCHWKILGSGDVTALLCKIDYGCVKLTTTTWDSREMKKFQLFFSY